ncbi:MAG: hypothetical protein K0R67_1850 [Paenibacillus sp.]|nr:hypothetical protein [Paenibacillus sp.]
MISYENFFKLISVASVAVIVIAVIWYSVILLINY